MDKDLTTDEKILIYRMMTAAKWDILFHDLAYFVPSLIIIILSALYESASGVVIGLVTYSILHLGTSIRQCKKMPLLQSAMKKLMHGAKRAEGALVS